VKHSGCKGIAVEAFLLREGYTGVERYILNLIRTLAQSRTGPITLFVLSACRFHPEVSNSNLSVRTFSIGNPVFRALFQHFIFPFWLRGYQKVFFTGYLGSLFFPASRTAISVFDLIALERPDLVKSKTRWYYRMLLPWFMRKAAILLVPSEKVRTGIQSRRNRTGILKLPIPVEEAFHQPGNAAMEYSNGFRKSVLIVGFGEKKKNHHLLRIIAPRLPDCAFLLVGKRIVPEKFPANVRLMGFLPQADLVQLYRQAGALAFLSREEGYGLPIYEALVSGTPVVCWKVAPFTETESPLLHHPDTSELEDYILKLEQVLSRPKPLPADPFQLIHWPEYWSKIESELLRR
jgi:glycosyltransferase involved in cell wall biosynthesis